MDQQEYFQKLNNDIKAEIRAELSKVPFPFPDDVDLDDFYDILDSVMASTSLNELKIDADIHLELIEGELNLFNITFILNAITGKSPNDLGLDVYEYNQAIKTAYEIGEIHTKHAKPIQDRIQKKYQAKAEKWQKEQIDKQANEQKQNGKKVIPLNRK